jgi:outer membrane protein OmpA-like peptidoglycan-associated protein
MRGLLFLIVFSSIHFTTLNAQDSILNRNKLPRTLYYFDDYVDYRNKVSDFDHASAKGFIRDGKFFYECKKSDQAHLTWMSHNIDPAQNYFVEMEFEQVVGEDYRGCGLVFNHTTTKKEDSWKFIVTRDLSFKIYKYESGVETNIVGWTKFGYLNERGNNKIAIFAKGPQMYFYINDRLAYNCKRPKYMGSDIGFLVGSSSTIAVDKFTIRYNPLPTNDIPDAVNGYNKIDLGKNINSGLDESFPVLSADGTLMFFSRSTNFGSLEYDKRTIMYSEFNKTTGEWSVAKPMPANINQGRKPQLVSVSPDKNSIILSGTFDKNGKYITDDGVAISYRTKNGWTNPESIKIPGYENLDEYDDYSLSANNKVLILSISKKGGFGERDMYVCFKQNGVWSSPKNLGATINSFADDFSPCIAPDNVTLYYASFGKPGYGKSDMFVTRRLDDTWLNWTEPENLGPEINNKFSNSGLQVDAFGQYAYIDEFKDNVVKTNIYKFQIPESARPKPVAILKGKVFNMLTKEPISLPVIYENMESNSEEGTAVSSPIDGSFVIVLPFGFDYGLTATAKGYISESKRINLKDTAKNTFTEMEVDLYVMPLTVGESIKLNNIFFAPDKFDLTELSFSELDRLVNIMNQNFSLGIEIAGHTDIGGKEASPESLETLSFNRANAVRNYLVSKGIEEKRITAKGYGNKFPVSTNQSLNRRVEVKILNL